MRRAAAITFIFSFMNWLLLAAACMSMAPCTILAASIQMTGTSRDFSDTHPDFETYIGVDQDIIDSDLGDDGRPVLLTDGTDTITSRDTFNQWYNDVDGVNVSTSYALVLENSPDEPNIYRFTNTSFFPIDGELFGNEGRSHNDHFTFMLAAEFADQGGEVFDFTGDDDVWGCINGKLVIDHEGGCPDDAPLPEPVAGLDAPPEPEFSPEIIKGYETTLNEMQLEILRSPDNEQSLFVSSYFSQAPNQTEWSPRVEVLNNRWQIITPKRVAPKTEES